MVSLDSSQRKRLPIFILFVFVFNDGVVQGCDITSYGAIGDGVTDETSSIQKVLDDPSCSSVIFPSGKTFSSGALHLTRSNVAIIIEEKAKLQGDEKHGIKQCDNEVGLHRFKSDPFLGGSTL